MAVESEKTIYGIPIVSLEGLSSRKREPLFNIEERLLRLRSKFDFESLGQIARRQIISDYKQLRWFPHKRSIYVKRINLILLDEIVFRIFNLSKFLKKFLKKSEVENE